MPDFLQRTVDWIEDAQGPGVVMIDQTRLPEVFETIVYRDYLGVAEAIRTMVVRGAPAIGAAAALGMALGAIGIDESTRDAFLARLEVIASELRGTRPTAVNLFWAIDRMTAVALATSPFDPASVRAALKQEAAAVLDEDVASNQAMGRFGAALLPETVTILTHCNAGALATVGYGTALGVVRAAVEQGKNVKVFADETRPRMQGMKLTAWELQRDGIDVTILSDNTAGYMMSLGKFDCVVVGADRIAANGDTANKIGTYSVALLAGAHKIPFYVAAPLSTVDFELQTGAGIPIEQRESSEVTHIGGSRISPEGVPVINYAFDVTPAAYITAIITDRGVATPPFLHSLRSLAAALEPG